MFAGGELKLEEKIYVVQALVPWDSVNEIYAEIILKAFPRAGKKVKLGTPDGVAGVFLAFNDRSIAMQYLKENMDVPEDEASDWIYEG
jgi:hypothetical protein